MVDPKARLLEALKALGWSVLSVVVGVVILALATSSNRVYPMPAAVGGIAAIIGAIGCVITLLMVLVRLIQWPPRRFVPPSVPAPPSSRPDRAPPRPAPSPAPASRPQPPAPAPAPATPEDERPTTIQPRPALAQTHPVDMVTASLFEYTAPNEDYSTWTTETLRNRLQGLDYTAMGMALHMGGVPDGMGQEMNDINAELSRRTTPGSPPPSA